MLQVYPRSCSGIWRNIPRTDFSNETLVSHMLDHHECMYPQSHLLSSPALAPRSRCSPQSFPPGSMRSPTSCAAHGCPVFPSSLLCASHDELRRRNLGRPSGIWGSIHRRGSLHLGRVVEQLELKAGRARGRWSWEYRRYAPRIEDVEKLARSVDWESAGC
jgi:hypothetical protein